MLPSARSVYFRRQNRSSLTDTSKHTKLIKEAAKELGFSHVGIAKAQRLDAEARRLEQWLVQKFHGKMKYMDNHFDKRVDPTQLVPGAKSVVSLMYNYHNPVKQTDPEAPKISQYAYGKDYHKVIKDKLRSLLDLLTQEVGEVSGRCFVDSAPVLERDWAVKSGIGWTGKNTLLINPKSGSYFFLAELILDLALEYDQQMSDYCGTCTRCIDACPTGAIAASGYVLDSRKCISYLTIELRDEIPTAYNDKMDNWMFGCDICQEVCPWNRFSTRHDETAFEPPEELLEMKARDWQELTEEVFLRVFNGSAVKRTKFKGLKRNIAFLNSDE
ncbi:MAG: tRNA epoxyqueuosine(34) reductase QueG [Saprospiraceae bacterium]|nr:tRNA epoxyqueuosine(34) reductase QueG [Saprospiraceae bacterium]